MLEVEPAKLTQRRSVEDPPCFLVHLATRGLLERLSGLAPATRPRMASMPVRAHDDLVADEHVATHGQYELVGQLDHTEVCAHLDRSGGPLELDARRGRFGRGEHRGNPRIPDPPPLSHDGTLPADPVRSLPKLRQCAAL